MSSSGDWGMGWKENKAEQRKIQHTESQCHQQDELLESRGPHIQETFTEWPLFWNSSTGMVSSKDPRRVALLEADGLQDLLLWHSWGFSTLFPYWNGLCRAVSELMSTVCFENAKCTETPSALLPSFASSMATAMLFIMPLMDKYGQSRLSLNSVCSPREPEIVYRWCILPGTMPMICLFLWTNTFYSAVSNPDALFFMVLLLVEAKGAVCA